MTTPDRRSEDSSRDEDETTPSLMFEGDGSRAHAGNGNVNVFADAFAAQDEFDDDEEFDGVADGFRPTESGHDRERQSLIQFDGDDDDPEELYRPSSPNVAAAAPATSNVPSARPSRNSTRKVRGTSEENPFADSAAATVERSESGTFAPGLAHRMSSTSSQTYGRSGTPRFGAQGSSHPYGMYAQTVPLSPSIRSSTGAPSRQSTIRNNGPTHPYAMYPQGVGDDLDDDEDVAPQNPVPLGFMGMNQTFRRHLGPDGEDQDIIGDYGHAEQLPPYTRYPEAGPEKMPLLAAPTALHSRAPVMGSDPGMPLMHQHLQPEVQPQSMSDQSALLQPERTRDSSLLEPSSAASQSDSYDSKKSWSEKSWRERRKTRFCGIPFWVYILALGVLSFIVAVVGGVIGGFVDGQENQEKKNNSLIPTPATATAPPTGSFKLALDAPQATQSACLVDYAQQAAWNCDLVGASGLSIEVSSTDSNITGASLLYSGGPPDNNLYYGAQASQMWTHYAPFMAVTDNEDPDRGLAYYFQQHYNKMVIAPNASLNPVTRKLKRDFYLPYGQSNADLQKAETGDFPWFCYWNSTLMEVFVYISEPVHFSLNHSSSTTTSSPVNTATNLSSATTTPPSTGASSPTTNTPGAATSDATAGVTATGATTAPPTSVITSTLSLPTATYAYTGSPQSFGSWYSSVMSAYTSSDSSSDDAAARLLRERETYIIEDVMSNGPQFYPYLVKIEERRVPGSPPPYCVQYLVLENGSWNVAPSPNGTTPYIIELEEDDPPFRAYQSEGIANRGVQLAKKTASPVRFVNPAAARMEKGKGKKAKRQSYGDGGYDDQVPGDSVPGACHCQWMSGEPDSDDDGDGSS